MQVFFLLPQKKKKKISERGDGGNKSMDLDG